MSPAELCCARLHSRSKRLGGSTVDTILDTRANANRQYAVGVARAFGGALLFSLPILMTMETWILAVTMDRLRLGMMMLALLPILVGLAFYSGFEETTRLADAVLDAFVAIAIASFVAAVFLLNFGVLNGEADTSAWMAELALQAVPGSIGALLAQSQFGVRKTERRKRREGGDFGEYFFMCAGALFLAANIAPTEEVVLIAQRMTPWHSLALAILSLMLMHVFVYAAGFRGQHEHPPERSIASVFVKFSLNGYMLALAISGFICWAFGRLDGLSPEEMLQVVIVLGLPAAIGAASARLVL